MSRPSIRSVEVKTLPLHRARPLRYARSHQTADGDVHLLGLFKVCRGKDDGLIVRVADEPLFAPTALNEALMNTFYSEPGFLLAMQNRLEQQADGTFAGRSWRSDDDLRTLIETPVTFVIDEAGRVDEGDASQWAGLICHRGIVKLPDGSLLAAMYGNFAADTVRPTHPQSAAETKYKQRAFVVRSEDRGATWRYLATLAAPDPTRPDATEGFNEWSMLRLDDGRLLAVIRTGHFSPLVLCTSDDDGRTWTTPEPHPDLGPAGCDPYLMRLSDGRIALAFGEMVQPPPGSGEDYWKDFVKTGDRRRRCRLAVSVDAIPERWQVFDLCDYADRSAYPTIFELEPGLLLYQSDLELWTVRLRAKEAQG